MDSGLLDLLPVAVFATDLEGELTYLNDAAASFWGFRPDLGSDAWQDAWRLWWPDGRPLRYDESPTAGLLREGHSTPVEAIAERPNGIRAAVVLFPKLLKDAEGRSTGTVNVLVEIEGQQQSHLNAERLAAIVTSSDDAIVSKDLDSIITSWNHGAERIFGYSAEEMIGTSIVRIIPERLQHEEVEIIGKLKRGERIDHYDTIRVRKDGKEIHVSITVSPIRDVSGRIVGASKVARDITQRKQDEAFQQLLIQELNHRVKNTLAIVQSIASQSLRKSNGPEHFVESFSGRVQSLAKAHSLLVQQRLSGISLSELVRDQVHLGATHDPRIEIDGPEAVVAGRDAINLGLVLHELATNARKYGALSPEQRAGRLRIEWTVGFRPNPTLSLTWKEAGVSGIRSPDRKGFGSTLIERTLKGGGGDAKIDFESDGLRCAIEMPLDERQHSIAILPPSTQGTSRRGRLLIIEDEPLIALELEELLTSTGFTIVGSAGTIEGAMRLVEAEEADAALLDANLHGRPVDEVAAALTRANIPFAFATGHDREGLPRSFAAVRILRKPFSDAEVVETVTELLRKEAIPLRGKFS